MDAERLRRELDRERQHRARLETELQQREVDVKHAREQWRRAAGELNRHKAQSKRVAQLTDQDVVDRVEQLRYEIKSFTFQHFESPLSQERIRSAFGALQWRLRMGDHRLEAYLVAPAQRHMVIRAFIWHVLVNEFYQQYRWCGKQISKSMSRLVSSLWPHDDDASIDNNEAMKKFQRWRFDTARLLVDVRDNKQLLNDEDNAAWFEGLINVLLYRPLKPLSKSPSDHLKAHLSTIVHQFMDLDRLLAMQVADYDWGFKTTDIADQFLEAAMTLEEGERLEDGPRRVALVLAPDLARYGKATGEDYHQATQLLKMQVSCRLLRRPPREEPKQTSHRRGKFWKFSRIIRL
ncbi:hypothetical protein HJFPF1_09696 [Paramyrothecium foliicola]|nr:hypothetical protein HJFPF1_09696 [Paramyrothecium foliicola]